MAELHNEPAGKTYEIKLKGHLDQRWADWFEGWTLTYESDGTTTLTGEIVDQAALHGLLKRIRDLGMPLLSVNCVESEQGKSPPEKANGNSILLQGNMMKAIVYENYGPPDVLTLKEIEKPAVGDDELLIRVRAAAVTPVDWHFMTGRPFLARVMAGGLFKPKHKVLGSQVAGQVVAVGDNVRRFQPGEAVFGRSVTCGGFAQYACIPEAEAWPKPADMSFEAAAAVLFSAIAALICLCDLGQIEPGQNVLINGASGGVGTLAVPIARSLGAQVTGVCSTRNLDLVRSIGAHRVIDYTQEDFTKKSARYDLIFDAVGKRSFSACQPVLSPVGIYVTTAFSPTLALKGKWVSITTSQKMIPMPPIEPKPHIRELFEELLYKGTLKPVIDRCYQLREVPEALHYFEKGHTRGRVVITI